MTDDRINAILDEISKVIVGKQLILKRVLASLLANGHILFHDVPGLAKTMMARSFSMVLGLSCDHRLIDGATGARFLQVLAELLENPASMLV